MTPRLKAILWWTPNLLFVLGACYVIPIRDENAFIIHFIQWMAWIMAISTALMAYTSHIDELIKRCRRHFEVPYILELVCDGGLVAVLATSGYYITAWVWFMQMVAVRKIYSRAHEHFEYLFMEKVKDANKGTQVTP